MRLQLDRKNALLIIAVLCWLFAHCTHPKSITEYTPQTDGIAAEQSTENLNFEGPRALDASTHERHPHEIPTDRSTVPEKVQDEPHIVDLQHPHTETKDTLETGAPEREREHRGESVLESQPSERTPEQPQFSRASVQSAFATIARQRTWPVDGTGPKDVESTFGPRVFNTGRDDFHRGFDIPAPKGTRVRAVWAGRVWKITTEPGLGNTVIIEHTTAQDYVFSGKTFRTFTTWYGHLDKIASGLKAGQAVNSGATIGEVGETGSATHLHLHFELRLGTWCSLEYQRKTPKSSCIVPGTSFDPHAHPALVLGPIRAPIQMKLMTPASTTDQALVQFTLPEDRPTLDHLSLEITTEGTQKPVRKHILDYTRREGYDATTTKTLDTTDTTRPYIRPQSFGPKATVFETRWVLPKAFLSGLPAGRYTATLVGQTVWGLDKSQLQWSFSY